MMYDPLIGPCNWCGGGDGRGHAPGCIALLRSSSLAKQRTMTKAMRDELNAYAERKKAMRDKFYAKYDADIVKRKGIVGTAREETKDRRTEVQKRFAAVAEELEDGKK